MKKSLIIDFNLLKELSLSINSFLYLYNVYSEKNIFSIEPNNEILEELQNNKLLKISNESIITIRQNGKDLIELLSLNGKISIDNKKELKRSSRFIDNEINNNIEDFRKLWKGKKPGSMGSKKSCRDKMKRWMEENPEYSFKDIIKAAKLYLDTEGMNLRFLQRADYFIYKQENNREESSRLSAYIDDIDNNPNEDWTSEIK